MYEIIKKDLSRYSGGGMPLFQKLFRKKSKINRISAVDL